MAIRISIENNVHTRDALRRVADHVDRMRLSAGSHDDYEACREIEAAIHLALEPEQLDTSQPSQPTSGVTP